MTITLTREEAQQVLEAFDVATTHFAKDRNEILAAIETLRARLSAPEPEPWAGVDFDIKTAPPQREWQSLTAYEIQELHLENLHWGNFACAIAAKLKGKNT